MSDQIVNQQAPGGEKRNAPYKFFVDDKERESEEPVLTGAQIKSLAGVDPSFGLILEGHGSHSDEPIADGQLVDLSEPGREKFYTAPPATFGQARGRR